MTGDLDLVEQLLDENLAPADLREGKLSLGQLSFSYPDADAERRAGRPLTDSEWARVRRERLKGFGIQLTMRGVTFTQQPIDLDKGNFEFAMQGWSG
ncbi:hypothetical protein [Actinopolymorpha pittospori]|uniref:ABC-type oligopeptide transport system substrate-binding subunit n=1 Tax=Actinopolymorpha pittospori TaxID=648752 RepID=A0A927MNI4_9ACTN|nr:hypothetical protein [Actinopolymorpha pittospori]MBE1603950.1 ABC-type oligopeptide transport system substrate-binding subunit [Actinopolymorpha pittospori]